MPPKRIKVIKIDNNAGEDNIADEDPLHIEEQQAVEESVRRSPPSADNNAQEPTPKPEAGAPFSAPGVQAGACTPKTRVQQLVDCDKCGKSMTAKSLKYYHPEKCPKLDSESKKEFRNKIDNKKQAVKDKKIR